MKLITYIHLLHLCITGILAWLLFNQKSELSVLRDEVRVSTHFINAVTKAVAQNYNPQISIPLQAATVEGYGITIDILDANRIQVGAEIFPFEEMVKRLTPESLVDKKTALITTSASIPVEQNAVLLDAVVGHLERNGISDITFSQK